MKSLHGSRFDEREVPGKGLPFLDSADVKRQLLAQAEQVCRQLLPAGKCMANEWVCGDLRGTPGHTPAAPATHQGKVCRFAPSSRDVGQHSSPSAYADSSLLELKNDAASLAGHIIHRDVGGFTPNRPLTTSFRLALI